MENLVTTFMYFSSVLTGAFFIFNCYMVWFRRKVDQKFRTHLTELLPKHFDEKEIADLLYKLDIQADLDFTVLKRLRELIDESYYKLEWKERKVMASALYQTSKEGKKNYIIKTTRLCLH